MEFFKYPQARILQLEDDIKRSEARRKDLEKQMIEQQACKWELQVISEQT